MKLEQQINICGFKLTLTPKGVSVSRNIAGVRVGVGNDGTPFVGLNKGPVKLKKKIR